MSLRPTRESAVERKAVADAKAAGWLETKVHKRGWPDRLFFRKRVYIWVEFKAPGETPRENQLRRLERLYASGERVLVIDRWDGFVERLDALSR